MSDIAIRVENLSKQYKIGATIRHDRLQDLLTVFLNGLFSRSSRSAPDSQPSTLNSPPSDYIWALKDISFEVKQGETLGIIGPNGAGKSTLLKILSRITEPTMGRAEIYGRVGSLLEVGTGFDRELTGRENIYLNGAILGMTKREIDGKFDEIVDFSGVEQFIDTPVKRYSSGMYVRLAFAVAAHLEPEILIVDEVLSVGDAAFQKKCLGKMGRVAREGRTVLFVSHNMGAILKICPFSILISEGSISDRGSSRDMVNIYLNDHPSLNNSSEPYNRSTTTGNTRLKFSGVYLKNEKGNPTTNLVAGHPLDIVLKFTASQDLAHVQFMLTIYNNEGVPVTHCHVDANGMRPSIPRGEGQIVCHIPRVPLPQGRYHIAVAAADDRGNLDHTGSACVFNVESIDFFGTPYVPPREYVTALVEHYWNLSTAQ